MSSDRIVDRDLPRPLSPTLSLQQWGIAARRRTNPILVTRRAALTRGTSDVDERSRARSRDGWTDLDQAYLELLGITPTARR